MFDFVDMFTGGLEFLQLGVQWTYQIAIYYGNMVFDIWALYGDVMSIFNGTYTQATIGYVLGFFVRNMFNPTM